MKQIKNPILTGFNPDPSIIRVKDDYYIVTSTFEWFPGCQIHHSKNLIDWQLISRPLNRVSQLDMRGNPDSCGVWAPCLSYKDGVFYLLYSNVRSFYGNWKDTPNYLVTATDIKGPWSDPVFVNASGFDASLFHDDDGRTYCINMLVDHRQGKFFGGIVLQEYCLKRKQLVGQPHHIFSGSQHGCTEGPHIYKRNGYYYLLTAEGGTGYEHCVTLARSKNILGPYDLHPDNPILTAKKEANAYLQKTGHADLVETPEGEWYMVFLASRPLTPRGRCILGRETAIEKMQWHADNWLYLANGNQLASIQVEAPAGATQSAGASNNSDVMCHFDKPELDIQFQSLRVPITDDWANTTDNPGYLRLYGRESLSSCFEQSLLGRRIQAHKSEAQTCIEFSPDHFQQMAGLACYYNTFHYFYLHIHGGDFAENTANKTTKSSVNNTAHSKKEKWLSLLVCDKHQTYQACQPVDLSSAGKVFLKAEFYGADLQFYYATLDGQWLKIGPVLDGSILSDDYVVQSDYGYQPCFTGAFYALACQDLSGQKQHADFSYFKYTEVF
ncbi:glycoside hydrolase family 43 protein [Catenovulum sediminis]|uniref:Glycoside hydrolase family 43 protein n=1 Tax=Catenovulum sediminis TaxID=1740262 RepID=A0ABV1RNV4_9ALTE|nr:glycoside hydrolase family 43 protein [Catenovulum sediminis]